MRHTLTVNREVSVTRSPSAANYEVESRLAANHLHIRHGFDEVAFGDALKRTVNEVFPWMVGPNKPRALLQNYGQLMRVD
jgi:hypothetical protein